MMSGSRNLLCGLRYAAAGVPVRLLPIVVQAVVVLVEVCGKGCSVEVCQVYVEPVNQYGSSALGMAVSVCEVQPY